MMVLLLVIKMAVVVKAMATIMMMMMVSPADLSFVCDNGDDGNVPRSQLVKYMHVMLVLSILIITIS